ncbi:SDR family oxidoreductase [Iamia sp. SCSIO 61187]|uniref:SDR family NAD(P)-dependent oxidoreductase n=1 Tax=Iamia sp. SCSIO 61187 TaxID=2722752 RepID=UPI001C639ACC|nr:SDR family oxidoreductase [Iamia sp. SCSIO 61187]QYG92477.1 SDR family oxidoreductase [Iamia sp. SCSIO 61187]
MDIQGRAAIVTGGGTGVGAATCRLLAARGCHVVVNYSRSVDAAEAVAAECRRSGVEAVAHRADVSVDADCAAMVEAAVARFGRLDLLVNNAGTTEFVAHDDLAGMSEEAWDRIMAVNLKGPFLCSRAAMPHLKADGGGEIVMTSSVAGLAGTGSSLAYCASKAGLNNLVVTLARVAGPEVRVNAVAPGFIDGEWLQQGLGDAYEAVKAMYAAQALTGRVSTPEDVAAAIVGLVTGSDQVTAHVVPVEGGALHHL